MSIKGFWQNDPQTSGAVFTRRQAQTVVVFQSICQSFSALMLILRRVGGSGISFDPQSPILYSPSYVWVTRAVKSPWDRHRTPIWTEEISRNQLIRVFLARDGAGRDGTRRCYVIVREPQTDPSLLGNKMRIEVHAPGPCNRMTTCGSHPCFPPCHVWSDHRHPFWASITVHSVLILLPFFK